MCDSGFGVGCTTELGRHLASRKERGEEQHPEHEIDETEAQNDGVYASAGVKNQNGNTERQLLEDRDQHQRPISVDVARDEEKDELPHERQPDETVEVFGIPNRFGESESGAGFREVLWGEDEDAVDGGQQEDTAGEFGIGEHDEIVRCLGFRRQPQIRGKGLARKLTPKLPLLRRRTP